MRNYIHENKRSVLATTFLIVATFILISTNELIAKALPKAEEMDLISCNFVEGSVYEYTGEEIKPEIESIVYRNKDESISELTTDEIIAVYTNNVELGSADVEVQLDGFRGSLLIEDIFSIIPATLDGLVVEQGDENSLYITWNEMVGADAYALYRRDNAESDFEKYYEIGSGSITEFVDTGIENNTTYDYCMKVIMENGRHPMYGEASETVSYTTQLDVPEMKDIAGNSYQSLEITWKQVDGAAGYEIYRSESKNGEYERIATIEGGDKTSYVDKDCECGQTYYYNVRAIQVVGEEERVGHASDVLSGKTVPNAASVSGSVNDERTSVTLSWNAAAGATGYELYKSVGSTSNYQLVKKFGENDARTWAESDLSADSAVYYRVRSFCEKDGEITYGSYSNAFQKQVKINMNYGSGSGSVAGVTQYVGTPYVWGGSSPNGWDCSGFTRWAMANYCGKSIPYGAASQGVNGASVSVSDRSQWQAGDILAYSDGSRISHVALYLGNGQMMHALNTKYGTIVQSVDYYEGWDSSNYLVSVRRY